MKLFFSMSVFLLGWLAIIAVLLTIITTCGWVMGWYLCNHEAPLAPTAEWTYASK